MLLPIGLGVSLPNIDQMVNKAFASYLGPGDTTAIMNAYRLMLLPIGVFAQAMALAVFPTLSGQAAENNLSAMRRTMNQSLRNILFLTVPASALMFLLAEPIITFLLQKGKFTHADTLVTASALRSLSLGIFAWSCQSLLTRGFYALQNSKVPVISGAIVSVLFVAMNAWVVRPVIQVKARVDALTRQVETLQANVSLVQPYVAAQSGRAHGCQRRAGGSGRRLPRGGDAGCGGQPRQYAGQPHPAFRAGADHPDRCSGAAGRRAGAAGPRTVRTGYPAARAVWELGLTTSIAATIHMIALYFLLRRRLTGLHSRRLLSSVCNTLMATLALCVVTKLVLAVCDTLFETSHLAPKVIAIVTLGLGGLAGIGAFAGIGPRSADGRAAIRHRHGAPQKTLIERR